MAVTERIGPGAEAKDKPSSTDKRYDSMADVWELVRDVDGGQRRVQAASTKYLPRHASELVENYAVRLAQPCFFNAFTRTIEGLTGLAFRRDPVLGDDVPAAIKEHCVRRASRCGVCQAAGPGGHRRLMSVQ